MILHLCYENEDDRLEVTEARGRGDGRNLNVTGSRSIVDFLQSYCPHKQEHRSYDIRIMGLLGTSFQNTYLFIYHKHNYHYRLDPNAVVCSIFK